MAAGKVPNANQREKRLAQDVDETENTLATAIGQAVAAQFAAFLLQPREVDGQLVPPLFHQVMSQLLAPLQPQSTACLFCALEAKQALAAYTVACEVAQKALEPVPEPPSPPIQQVFTWLPVQAAPNVPPVAAPVCFDHLQAQPQARPVGLVLPDGRPVVAQR